MEVSIPHSLGKATVRERLHARSHKIADGIPGGMAQVATDWPTEDRMTLNITAMGQVMRGHVDIEDDQLIMVLDLPPALGFMKPMLEGALRQQGQKLLGPARSDEGPAS